MQEVVGTGVVVRSGSKGGNGCCLRINEGGGRRCGFWAGCVRYQVRGCDEVAARISLV